jgi:Mce-associated membrane protein
VAVPEPDLATPDPAVAPADEPPSGPPARRRGALVAAIALAVVFAVAASVLAVLLAREDDGGQDDLREAAGAFGEALVTYDHTDPEAHRDAVLARSTGSFRTEYDDAFDQGLGKLITELQATSQGFVKDVYLTAVDAGQALAIVVMDVESDGSGGPRTVYDVYVRLTMIQVDGRWLVDDVTDLSFGSGAGLGDGVTTDTTAPTTTSVP